MKKFLFLTVCLLISAFNNLSAQSAEDEANIKTFTENFMAAYNQQDVEAIEKMYTENAERWDTEGNKIEGAKNIAAFFGEGFIKHNTTLTLNHQRLSWVDAEHAFVAYGTYEIKGKIIANDAPIHIEGEYSIAMWKDNGEWKIMKSVLTAKK